MNGPFAQSAMTYRNMGWLGTLPVPLGTKGWTGADGATPSVADVTAWAESPSETEGGGNIALRLPHRVLGLDVDAYGGKVGGATLAGLVETYGPLPSTWCSTSRDDGVSGIRFFTIPTGLAWPGVAGAGIEVIQYRHRYAVVAPSVHPDGRTYRWIGPDGRVRSSVPRVDSLPELPESWVVGLTDGQAATATERAGLTSSAAQEWLTEHGAGEPCSTVAEDLASKQSVLAASATGSRHDAARGVTMRLVQLAADGHPGAGAALNALQTTWTELVGEDHTRAVEFTRMVSGAVDIVAAGPVASVDPCAVTTMSGDGWGEMVPLKAAASVEAFPVDTLPTLMAEYVEYEATATQTPPDLASMLVLAVIATVAAGTVQVEVRPGWIEPVNLYAAVALPPGARKSAVFHDVTRPLVDFDRSEVERMRPQILEDTTAKKVAERAREHAEAAAGKAGPDQAQAALVEAQAAAMNAAKLTVAAQPRLLADDITPEALSTLLADTPYDRQTVLSPDGGLFQMMAGRYQNGPNLDVYLKGHAGDEIRIDRKSRDPEFVRRPAVTLGLAIQPEVLRALDDRPGFRGRGLLARFLYSLPVNTVGTRTVCPRPMDPVLKGLYAARITAIAETLRDQADKRLGAAEGNDGAAVTG